ncbi:hypothetical protein GGS24DRAFT_508069 [Hypoxylon argillaceum]|nr:hypothetical protein GGS24DRAFT_508069 [Hypoxylon argillaceum]
MEIDSAVTVPPLTSIFIPAPSCLSLCLEYCEGAACYASIGASAYVGNSSCYPESSIVGTDAETVNHDGTTNIVTSEISAPVFTYSPGLFCPSGMTTAATTTSPDAVYCCHHNFAYKVLAQADSGYCFATLTEGTFLYQSATIMFDPSHTAAFSSAALDLEGSGLVPWSGQPTLRVAEPPVFLLAQTLSSVPQVSKNTSKVAEMTSQVGGELGKDDPKSSMNLGLGFAIGVSSGSVGAILLICLGIFFLKRYRTRRLGQGKKGGLPVEDEQWNEQCDKPELEGSRINRGRFRKAELDASVTRAELEGSPVEENDPAGVGVLKPELHGTPGVSGLRGVYIKRKGELEASSNLNATEPISPLPSNSVQSEHNINNATKPAELDSRSIPHRRDIGRDTVGNTP